jgi:putative toxin-antitoxin system antitoxin component (TIGR02293 family)
MTTHRNATEGVASAPRDVERFRDMLATSGLGPHSYAILLGLRTSDWPKLLRNVQRGLPYDVLGHLQKNTGLSAEKLLAWLQIAPRTLTRRKQRGHFLREESDRLLRAARVFGRALELFEGDAAGATDWLLSSQPALGGLAPIDAAETEIGSREVEDLIGRLEHGVYS